LPLDDKPADLDALRKARLNHLEAPPDERRKKMKYIGETVTREPARKIDIEQVRKASAPKRRRQEADPERKHRHRKARPPEEDGGAYQSVYQTSDDRRASKKKEGIAKETDAVEIEDRSARAEHLSGSARQATTRKSKTRDALGQPESVAARERRTPQRRQSEPVRRINNVRRNSYGIDECQPVESQR
jgi:hypothetical protein